MNKKLLMFGLPLLAVVLVSAALLTYYGVIAGSVTTTQSVVLIGNTVFEFDGSADVIGQSFHECSFSVKNNADVEVPVVLVVDQQPEDSETPGKVEGIDTEVWGVVELSGKDSCYAEGFCTLDSIPKATVYYTMVGDGFKYKIEDVKGIDLDDYTLVYYPEAVGYESSDYTGKVVEITESIGSLPFDTDLNKVDDEYCTNNKNPNSSNCYGAKLWLVLTTNLNAEKTHIDTWNEDTILFETDLIQYTKDTEDSEFTLLPGVELDFCVDNEFALNLIQDTYTIKVSMIPPTE